MNRQLFHNMIASSQGYMYEAGRRAEYDRFWDAYQNNGAKRDYGYAFGGSGWTDETFKPKYQIIATGILDHTFANARMTALPENMDTSGATNFSYSFVNTGLRAVSIDCSSATNLEYSFYNSPFLVTLNVANLKETCTLTSPFAYCPELVNFTITGTIGKSGFSAKHSTKLSRESIENIINVLSPTTNGLSITLSQTAVYNAFTDAEWNALKATKSNWTINLG